MMATGDLDRRHMAHALRLGRRGLGTVWPNPAVGCVIVRDGRVVGRGWTRPGGRPHAERVALDQAGAGARGATAYVTLEPCAHYGRTPPCANALIEAGVARVVTAMTDPDPRVSGRGHAILRAAGIAVTEGICGEMAARDQRGFLNRLIRGRPLVTLKLAFTLDGRIATATGESRWITGAQARTHVHVLRAAHDAIMVGGGTARADRPLLNVRGIATASQPVRIVVSSAASLPDLPPEGPAFGPLWQVGGELPGVMTDLAARGLTRIFCEGGGHLAAALLRAGLVDEVVCYHAGRIIGAEGRAGVGAMALLSLAEAPRFHLAEIRRMGEDVMHRWQSVPADCPADGPHV